MTIYERIAYIAAVIASLVAAFAASNASQEATQAKALICDDIERQITTSENPGAVWDGLGETERKHIQDYCEYNGP